MMRQLQLLAPGQCCEDELGVMTWPPHTAGRGCFAYVLSLTEEA
jgi:hypothetical protein